MKKACKMLAFMLAFIMMFTALPVAELSAFAAEPAKLTEAWAPSALDTADWNGATDKITNGVFALTGTESQFTIWTNQSFNVDDGFTFKGTLKMSNGYNNCYGEWCSAYIGTASENLELRIRNDYRTGDEDKDLTYTAYLLYNGTELASYDLNTSCNGAYEVKYKDGKVTVKLADAEINWTLANRSKSTTVTLTNADFSNAQIGLRLSGNWGPENGRMWSAISLAPVIAIPALTGTGVEFGPHNPPVSADWQANNTATQYNYDSGNPTGNVVLKGNNNESDATLTYKDKFNVTNGFSLNYSVNGENISKNYTKDRVYHGVKIGNITAGIQMGSYNRHDSLELVIKIDGETVATSEAIVGRSYSVSWNDDKEDVENLAYYLRETVVIFKRVYSLVYNPETDTLSFSNGARTATVSGVSHRLKLDEATLSLVNNNSWNIQVRYYFFNLLGDYTAEIPTAPENPALPDLTVSPDIPTEPIVPDTPLPEIPANPEAPDAYGEAFTQLWEDTIKATDWQGDTDAISSSFFRIGSDTNESKTIWTNRKFNLSEGFELGAYYSHDVRKDTNFMGEWSSIYVGSESNNLEFRISSDDITPMDANIDNTYSAHLFYNGNCIASSDLGTEPGDADYTILYKNGKIRVSKDGATIAWTIYNNFNAAEIAIHPYFFANAKIGLRLQGNLSDSKSWFSTYVSPVPTDNNCGAAATWNFDVSSKTLYINGTGELYSQRNEDSHLNPWNDIREEVKNIVIAEDITGIGKYNFAQFTALENVQIPSSVKSIGWGVFCECTSLKEMTIPVTVTSLAGNLFRNCTSLESVTISADINYLDMATFSNCTSLKKVVLSNSIESLFDMTFTRCTALEELTIPKSLSKIETLTFYECTSLKTVYYTGSEADKNNLEIKAGNDPLVNATWHYNSCYGAAEHTYDTVLDPECNVCGDIRQTDYTGWLLEGNVWYYYQNGAKATGWLQVGYSWYYFNENGAMQTGWLLDGDTWYYFADGGNMLTGWQQIGYFWYYFNDYGAMLTGWQLINYNWYYFADGGNMVTGWQLIGGTWYYFNAGGNMATGWLLLGSTWYYLAESGAMVTGWQYIGSSWYYFADGGNMATGWLLLGSTWYYLADGGNMLTGWQYIGSTWYYFADGGNMLTDWQLLGGTWYYFNEGGAWIA